MKQIASVVVGLMLAGLGTGAALAGSDNHATPGTPGSPNCVGQTMAYLAQGNDVVPGPGIGNLAKQLDLSVKDVKAVVEAYCAGP